MKRIPTLLLLAVCCPAKPALAQHNYAAAFQQALYWYEAQTSGAIPLDHRVEWRGDSAMRDGSDVGRDLTGGWYDAGDGVVWTANDAFGATLLAWSLRRDRDIYISTGQYQRALDRLREINNYFAKIIDESGPGGAIQRIYVGKGSIKNSPPDDPAATNDRTDLVPHETLDTPVGGSPQTIRPSYWVDSTTGGADVAGSLAAALASSSIAFRLAGDVITADTLLARARKVYAWGEANPNSNTNTRRMTNGAPVTIASYPVRSASWAPRMIHAAAWLHRAEIAAATPGYSAAYADKAETLYNSADNANFRSKPWLSYEQPGQQMGGYAILAADTGRAVFVAEANAYANFWAYRRSNTTGLSTDITLTPGGFLARNRPSDATGGGWNINYLMDQAPPLLDWADSAFNTNATLKADLKALFKGQLAYILGSNPKGKSYLQGYDAPGGGATDWMNNAHYRANLGSYGGFGVGAPATNAYPCYGLILPGPGHTDEYPDTAPAIDSQIKYKEPIVYSGGLLTVLAQKIRDDGMAAGAVPGVFPPWINRGANYQTESFFVQAYREDGIVANGTRLQVAINNRATLPASEINTLAFRYYYTPDGVAGTAVTASAALIGGLSGETITVHGPTQVGASATWYYEFRFNNAYIVPGEYSRYRRRAQIDISQSGGTFSLANDHSGDTVANNATYNTAGDMPVYDFSTGKLLGGFEPSAGYIQWRRAHFNNANEHAPTITLIAERVGGTNGAVTATVSLANGTATAGADFTVPGNLTLSWSAGETGEKTLSVPLVEDPYDEGRHYFAASLGSFTGGAAAGLTTEARVSIEDNDFGGPPDPGGLVQVLGNALIIASGDSTPAIADHTDFGSAEVNYAAGEVTRTFTIRNNDSNPLSLTGSPRVQITGTHDSNFLLVSPPPETVPAQGTATFQVKFAPSAAGSRTATLTIPNSNGAIPNYQFAIRGTGTPPGPVAQLAGGITATLAPSSSGSASTLLYNLGRGALDWAGSLPANYTASSSSAPGGPTYQWIDISATGNVVWAPTSSDLDDTTSSAINLPFSIPFYGTNRSQFKVCSNGWLTFDTATTANDWSNLTIPFSGNTNARPSSQAVFPWWDDLYLLGNVSRVVWQQVDPDTVVIQWHNVTYFTWRFTAGSNPGQRFSFQVLLKRNGDIICQYKDVLASPDSNRYTIGLQNANASGQWLQYAYNTPSAETGVALRFSPPPNGSHDPAGTVANWASFSGASSGTTAVDGSTSIGLSLNTTGLVSGQTYRTSLTLTTTDPARPTILVPVTLAVSGVYNLGAAGIANRAWDTAANWSPAAVPGPADRWNLTTGGGSIDLRGDRSLGDVTVNAASAVTLHGQGIAGSGSGSRLSLNGATLIQQGGLLVGGWNASLLINGPLTIAGGSFGFGPSSNGAVTLSDDSAFTLSGGTFVTAANYNSVNYFTHFGSGDASLASSTTSAINVPVSGEQEFTRRLTGSGNLVKNGLGTLLLEGAGAAHTGTVEVAAGTLKIGGQDVLGDASLVRLTGGTFAVNGFAETVGALDIDGNSVIDLSGGPSSLTFADSSAQTWSATSLAITGFVPGVTSIRFGTNGSALTAEQLSKITVNGGAATLAPSGHLDTALPPEWSSTYPKADTLSSTGFTVRVRIPEDGTAYFVVVPDGEGVPSAAQVKAGQNASGSAALRSGTVPLTANTEGSSAITGLSSNTAYDVYFLAEDLAPNTQTTPQKVDVTTLPDSYTWTADASGSWSTATNWTPAGVPNAPAITVTFGPAITTNRTVTLNTNATVGVLVFNEDAVGANAYTVAFNSGQVLTFDATTGNAQILARGSGGYALGGTPGVGTIQLMDTLEISAGAAQSATSDGGTVNISYQITGSNGLVLSSLNSNDGTGTAPNGARGTFLRSTNANTFSGGVVLNSGYLGLSGNINNLGTGTLTINASDSSNGGIGTVFNLRAGGGTLTNNIVIGNPGATGGGNPRLALSLSDSTTQSYTFTGALSGNMGNQTMRFSTFNNVGVNNSSSLTLAGDGGGLFSSNSAVLHVRTGTLILSNANALGSNNLVGGVSTGGLQLGNFSSGSTGTNQLLTAGFNVASRIATLAPTSAGNTSGDTLVVGGIHTNGTATFSNTITIGRIVGGSRTFQLTSAGGGTTVFAGIISDGNASGSAAAFVPVVKAGAGTVSLTASNTYAGGTTVSNGTLLVNNTSGSGTGSGPVNVAPDATLGGTGTVAGAVNIASGGRLTFHLATAPASHDRFDCASLTLAGASTLIVTASQLTPPSGTYILLRAATPIASALPSLVLPPGFGGSLSISGGDLILSIAPLTPIELWRQANFGSTANSGNAANSANPDSDQFNNLAEYAFGLNPNVANSGVITWSGNALTQRGGATVSLTTTEFGVDYRAVFGRRKDYLAAGLTYTVQFSADLQSWESSTATPTIVASDAEIDVVTVPYPFFLGDGRKARFFRVQVIGP